MRRAFVGPQGLRRGWKAAIVLACAWLMSFLVSAGLGLLMDQLLLVWGVTAKNLARAPGWIQLLVGHYAAWSAMVQNALLVPLGALFLWLFEKKRPTLGGMGAQGLASGLLLGAVLTGLLLLLDGVRLGRPVMQSARSAQVFIPLLLYAVSAVGGEALFRSALPGVMRGLSRWVVDLVCAAAFAWMTAPGVNAVALVNLTLMGLILAVLARAAGGFLAGAAARFGFYAMVYVVFGCKGGAAYSLYECYPAALDSLSGGADGPLAGLMLTALLLGVGGTMWMRWKKGRREK